MRTPGFRCFLLAAMLAAGTSCRQSVPEREATADSESIKQVGEEEVRAFNAGDIEGNLATLTRDVVMMPAGEPLLTGTDAVRAWLRGLHDKYTINLRYTESHIDVVGDWAIQRYVTLATVAPKKGGKPMEDRGKGIHIYRRQPDGRWLIAQDIWNSDSPSTENE